MTEAEWLACANPTPMWWFIEGAASERRLRLIACACCRRIWHLLTEERSKQCIETAEKLADGMVTREEANQLLYEFNKMDRDRVSSGIDEYSVTRSALISHNSVIRAVPALASSFYEGAGVSREEEARRQTNVVRDIFNPFRPSPPLPPAVLAWSDGTVRRLAEAIYEERKMPEGTLEAARLAILADALLDAGCEDEDLIQHCRSEGPHVRGCWALDLCLGKS
jgi:hypothetical protein